MIKTGSIDISSYLTVLKTQKTCSLEFPQYLIDSIGLSNNYTVEEVTNLPLGTSSGNGYLETAKVLVFPDGHISLALYTTSSAGSANIGLWYDYISTYSQTSTGGSISTGSYTTFLDYIYNTDTDELIFSGHCSYSSYYLPLVCYILDEEDNYVSLSPFRTYSELSSSRYSTITAGDMGYAKYCQTPKKDSILSKLVFKEKETGNIVKSKNTYIDDIRATVNKTQNQTVIFNSVDNKYKYYMIGGCGISGTEAYTLGPLYGFREEL